MGQVTVRARDKVCPGCGGRGGAHVLLKCAYLRDELARSTPSAGKRRQKRRA